MSAYPVRGLRVRYIDSLRMAELFLYHYNARNNSDVKIDASKLYIVVKSAMDDVQRYKDYHLGAGTTKLADAVKRSAYLTKWMVRLKPLCDPHRAHDSEGYNLLEEMRRPAILVNEEFALSLSLLHLGDHLDVDLRLSGDKLRELIYVLLYRNVSEDGFMMLYQIIVDVVGGRKVFI